MGRNALLPKPLPSDELAVGQFITHPLKPELDGFYSSTAAGSVDELNDYFIQLRYKDVFSLDQEGRFAQSYGAKFDLGKIYRKPNLLSVLAEQMIQRVSKKPLQAFEAVCADPEALAWITDMVEKGQDFFFVAGITEFKNAVFKRAVLQDGGVSNKLREEPIEKGAKVPKAVRRDSILGLGTEANLSGVFGMDVRRVMARIGRPEEPHTIGDLKAKWVYHKIPDSELQLMVGLGEQVQADELRSMLDLTEEDVQVNLDNISRLGMDALTAAASPLLKASSPALRGRSPSPHPGMKHLRI
ncbi:hypothetical protein K432DRAFT_385965 [Lepidopterella palustris CBS 459.81]|uniref:Uncharacterized protein n=1 Tax=Lepidopterella palustris CBS 459.81 TaxID=1314670 RepID=A0A8E2E1R5_9PEZI|nr:hypothetical protein K432DRAFT_385965 [Lepidopterella palustris CBS 459.81]